MQIGTYTGWCLVIYLIQPRRRVGHKSWKELALNRERTSMLHISTSISWHNLRGVKSSQTFIVLSRLVCCDDESLICMKEKDDWLTNFKPLDWISKKAYYVVAKNDFTKIRPLSGKIDTRAKQRTSPCPWILDLTD